MVTHYQKESGELTERVKQLEAACSSLTISPGGWWRRSCSVSSRHRPKRYVRRFDCITDSRLLCLLIPEQGFLK